MESNTSAALAAIERGYQAVPLRARDKRPVMGSWQMTTWAPHVTAEEVEALWARAAGRDATDEEIAALNVGVTLGEPSGNLVDIDLDHFRTARLKDYYLPPTAARSGHAGKPNSHYWYIVKDGTLQGTRQYLMPRSPEGKRGEVIVEYRSTGAQTVIPPSVHPSGEEYTWASQGQWGGKEGPAVVDGRQLATQVALLALTTVLLQYWPTQGTRHEAYLSLVGGLLRLGDGVHPFWERNVATLVEVLAEATLDEDGPESRVAETVNTTLKALRAGKPAVGFGKMAEILGDNVVDQVRTLVAEVEQLSGFASRQSPSAPAAPVIDTAADTNPAALSSAPASLGGTGAGGADGGGGTPPSLAPGVGGTGDGRVPGQGTLPGLVGPDPTIRDPLGERIATWEPVDIDPYLTGRVEKVMPSVMARDDGAYLMYPGRVNMLYGSSESAKSWIALYTCMQEMAKGRRTLYLDFEDEPVNTISRLLLMGADPDDLRTLFTYVRPEEPLAPMQFDRWGHQHASSEGARNWEVFTDALNRRDPSLIVADGMTVLYGLHGLDTNDSGSTDIITNWLKKLTRNGRSTVIIIAHTGKGAERGALPIGSQHKQAMVQGTMLQVHAVTQPMPGQVGEVEVIVLKDRPGQVRAVSVKSGQKAQVAARVVMDSTGTVKDPFGNDREFTDLRIMTPMSATQIAASGNLDFTNGTAAKAAERAQRLQATEDVILLAFRGELGKKMSYPEILTEIGNSAGAGFTDKELRAAIARLADEGGSNQWLKMHGSTKNREYELIVGGGGFDIDLSGVS